MFYNNIIKRIVILSFFFIPLQSLAQTEIAYQPGPGQFSDHNPTSQSIIDHGPLTDYLTLTVLPVGRSLQFMGYEKPEQYIGSKIRTAKPMAPSRFEGSRLFIHAFTPEVIAFFQDYQKGLEVLSERRSLASFNRNEQLAFWLNLYNVIVINKVVQEYPISNLSRLRDTGSGKSFWREKVVTIEGTPLSLGDIERILFTNYASPLVAFGLWQGSVGGPGLMNYAFNGKNVWRTLEDNAVEFVNSNRGLRPLRGSQLKVSKFYEWTRPAFGRTDADVLGFIKRYADPNFTGSISRADSISYGVYNWTIADILGGTLHTGSKSQLGGVLGGKSGMVAGPGNVATPGEGLADGMGGGLFDMYKMVDSVQRRGPLMTIPDAAFALLMGIKQNTEQPTPVITFEECAPGEACPPRADDPQA